MKMNLMNIEVANILAYMGMENSIANNTAIKFSINFAWKFRKNINKLRTLHENFLQVQQEIMTYYSDDQFSYIKIEEPNDKDDKNTPNARVVKDEYLEDYNKKLNDLYTQNNEIDIDMVELSEIACGDISLSIPDMDMLSFMISEDKTIE